MTWRCNSTAEDTAEELEVFGFGHILHPANVPSRDDQAMARPRRFSVQHDERSVGVDDVFGYLIVGGGGRASAGRRSTRTVAASRRD
jgi:hypothetical protein